MKMAIVSFGVWFWVTAVLSDFVQSDEISKSLVEVCRRSESQPFSSSFVFIGTRRGITGRPEYNVGLVSDEGHVVGVSSRLPGLSFDAIIDCLQHNCEWIGMDNAEYSATLSRSSADGESRNFENGKTASWTIQKLNFISRDQIGFPPATSPVLVFERTLRLSQLLNPGSHRVISYEESGEIGKLEICDNEGDIWIVEIDAATGLVNRRTLLDASGEAVSETEMTMLQSDSESDFRFNVTSRNAPPEELVLYSGEFSVMPRAELAAACYRLSFFGLPEPDVIRNDPTYGWWWAPAILGVIGLAWAWYGSVRTGGER